MTELDELLNDFHKRVLERNPHTATLLAIHNYELPNGTREPVIH
ncbi:MAG: hypothetical protein U5J64_10370 [Halobacteriales archaeon]|nr:hypothetical protein [Halobacteriales archaeon]